MADEHSQNKISRKDFLKMGGALAGLAISSSRIPDTALAAGADTGDSPAPGWKEGDDILLRMQDDVSRALLKPKKERKWTMAIDTRKCVGCSACTISCIAENKLPPGVVYRPVREENTGTYPHLTRSFWPRPCLHCENPPCVSVCPVKATHRRDDGIVVVDYEKCIGCRYCITACPYSARYSDFGEHYTAPAQPYETIPSFEYKNKWPRKKGKSPIGNARKCHFCIHLIEDGVLPRCVSACIGRATYFGDLNDTESLIHSVSKKPNIVRLKEELGTKPTVFYLI